ncbi:MAG TPA: tetratricopeptide repeat protein [Terriglobales bacterium]|nr:tetratricopeptide repeat protein [Terriglobales bacterium]
MPGRYVMLLMALCGFGLAKPASPQTTPSAEQYAEIGNRALQDGRYPEAEQAFEKLRDLEPNTAEVHANLGLIYFEEREFDQSVPELRRALKLKPSLTNSAFILAMSLSELGQYTEALPGLAKGFRSGNPQMKRMCGLQLERAYTGLKRDSEAVKVALEMEQLYPNDAEVQYHDGKIFGNFAFLTMQKLWQAAPDSVWKHQAEGEALESQGSFEAAIGQYREVLAKDPQRPGIHYKLGRILLARSQKTGAPEDTSAAAKEFEEELRLDPANGNAAYELAEIKRNAGRFDDAQKYFELALKGHADFEEAQLGLAATLISEQKPELALPHLEKAISLNRDNEVAWWRMAQVERLLGNSDEQKKALAEFQRIHSQAAQQQDQSRKLFSPNEVTQQQVESGSRQ